jgi:hypothetical protein
MKKEYMKPTMLVVELKHRSRLLVGSPYDQQEGKPVEQYKGGDNTLYDNDNIF